MKWACFAIVCTTLITLSSCKKTDLSAKSENLTIANVANADILADTTINVIVDSPNISGIDYIDNIYDLGTPDTKAYPVYHSPYSQSVPCNGDTSSASCIFDETDLNLDGKADVLSIKKAGKLIVDSRTGVIDMAASFQGGLFGSDPTSGMKKTINFFYRLNDESKRALKKVSVQVIHYKTPADIPNSVKAEIALRQQQYAVTSTTMFMAYAITYQPKRPPLLIIVSRL
jgi:hypothetical protein